MEVIAFACTETVFINPPSRLNTLNTPFFEPVKKRSPDQSQQMQVTHCFCLDYWRFAPPFILLQFSQFHVMTPPS